MEDIGKVLYERVKANFDRRCEDHYLIKTISKRIANSKADMIDLSSYAGSLGAQLANAILDEVTQDLLPDGRLYHNIAKSIIEPMLRGNYDLINSVADELQASLDRKLSYRIKAQHAPFPQERVNTAIGAASQEGIDWETVRRRMSSTPENITHAMSDDYMKVNAEFRSKAGIDTYIERRDDGKCCEWCSKLAGRYRYPEQVPRDVFRRHDNCGCLVSYVTPGGMRQNVHSKRDWSDEDQREYLKQLDEDKKRKREERKARWGDSYDKVRRERIVFSPKEAAEREKIVKEKIAEKREMALTKGGKGGIINYKDSSDIKLPKIVDSIPQIEFFDNAELNASLNKAAEQLINEARKHSPGTEIAYIIKADPPYSLSEPIFGEEGAMAVKIPRSDYPAITLHNHPSGKSFSGRDIDNFSVDTNANAMCVIGNDGTWYVLEKKQDFDWIAFQTDTLYISDSDNYAESILKEADRYGFNYYYTSKN